jgi:hypothetical protein
MYYYSICQMNKHFLGLLLKLKINIQWDGLPRLDYNYFAPITASQ